MRGKCRAFVTARKSESRKCGAATLESGYLRTGSLLRPLDAQRQNRESVRSLRRATHEGSRLLQAPGQTNKFRIATVPALRAAFLAFAGRPRTIAPDDAATCWHPEAEVVTA